MTENIPVTVLMAVRNEEHFVAAAVESILGQTFRDFEFVIVDDASTDGTPAYLAALRDPRVRVLRLAAGGGQTRALVHGMSAAHGALVARMDADDMAHPDRLARQVFCFARDPALGILGSNARVIDEQGRRHGCCRRPGSDLAIRWRSLLDNPFLHPSVMFRRAAYDQAGGYDPDWTVGQDYDLWTRMLRHANGRNLAAPLLWYRQRAGAVTSTRRSEQLANHDRVAWRTLTEVLPEVHLTPERCSLLRALYAGGNEPVPPEQVAPLVRDFMGLLGAFVSQHCGEPGLARIVWFERLRSARRLLQRPFSPGVAAAWFDLLRPIDWADAQRTI